MKITLINPPISLDDVYGRFKKLASFQPPVGLASLAGYLLQYKHDITIIDCNALGLSVDDTVRLIKSEPPDGESIRLTHINIRKKLNAQFQST